MADYSSHKIIHIDMDAFYASIEMRDFPELRGRPIAVGGSSERRGVIATCNYEARKYGVRSAMPTKTALKKCPQLVLKPGRMSVYKAVSQQIREIFFDYTSLVEPLSLDEAYLDVTNSHHCNGSATLIAAEIKQRILDTTKLTASAGVAPLKYLAKIASDIQKPNGLTVIAPHEVDRFIDDLALSLIPGVGKVTQAKLAELGFHYGRDIKAISEAEAIRLLGNFGQKLWQRCHGASSNRVNPSRIRKSIGVERTFASDESDLNVLKKILIDELLPELYRRINKHRENGLAANIKGLTIKVKFANFEQTTADTTGNTINESVLYELLRKALSRRTLAVRLLGISVKLDTAEHMQAQLDLF